MKFFGNRQTPSRLPSKPTSADWRRMALHPSTYAPTADEVLKPSFAGLAVAVPDLPLRAVLDDPDADAPRLAYAKWVEATDPGRAKFIRMQLAGHPVAPLPHFAEPFSPWGARDIVFRRGFAEGMSLTGRSFISLGDRLFELTPLRDVRLIAVNFLMGELVACRHLVKLKRLDLSGNRIGDAGAERLLGCEYLAGVTELELNGNDFSGGTEARLRSRFGSRVAI